MPDSMLSPFLPLVSDSAYVGALRDALAKHRIPHEYYAGGGGAHDWATWRHLLYAKLLPGLWRKSVW